MAAKAFGSFYLLNNSFVPMDLAMGMEMGRFMYIYWIEYDAQMTVVDLEKKEAVGAVVKNFSLHEDLAQIDYILCDKTGTLTQNELIFQDFQVVETNESLFEASFENGIVEEDKNRRN